MSGKIAIITLFVNFQNFKSVGLDVDGAATDSCVAMWVTPFCVDLKCRSLSWLAFAIFYLCFC